MISRLVNHCHFDNPLSTAGVGDALPGYLRQVIILTHSAPHATLLPKAKSSCEGSRGLTTVPMVPR